MGVAQQHVEEIGKKRVRSSLTAFQQMRLCEAIDKEAFPSKARREELAAELGCPPRTVQIWFQNQRQKVRRTARQQRVQADIHKRAICGGALPGVWLPVPAAAAPPGSPKLSYSGPDSSPELNALVDAAVEELSALMPNHAVFLPAHKPVLRFSLPGDTVLPPQRRRHSANRLAVGPIGDDESPSNVLRKAIPVSLMKSPAFRAKVSHSNSPKLKTLQPRAQANSTDDASAP